MATQNPQHLLRLIQECLKGKAKAQRDLYEHFAPIVYPICLRYSSNPDNAKDVLQDGFVRLFTHLSDFKDEGSFEGWVRRIFVNTALEHCRKHGRLVFSEDQSEYSPEASISPEVYQHIAYKDLLHTLSLLPEGYRTVFNLFIIEGWSHKEIANELNISESTSKTQLFKARRQLQVLLKHLRTD